jgi:hypothetical protein
MAGPDRTAHTSGVVEGEYIGETAAQIPVISAAWRFLVPFYEDKNLGAAWPHTDPTLRLCWAQWWADANRTALQANGHDLDKVAQALADVGGRHGLWPDFERVVIRDVPADGIWAPEAASEVVPLVMRLTDDAWRVLNLGYEALPEPGWPPKLR